MRLEFTRSLELFFPKKWKETVTHPFPLFFLCCSFTFDNQRIFVTLQFAHPMTPKSLNLAKELGEYWKVLDDKYVFNDKQFYLISFSKKTTSTKFLNQMHEIPLPWEFKFTSLNCQFELWRTTGQPEQDFLEWNEGLTNGSVLGFESTRTGSDFPNWNWNWIWNLFLKNWTHTQIFNYIHVWN